MKDYCGSFGREYKYDGRRTGIIKCPHCGGIAQYIERGYSDEDDEDEYDEVYDENSITDDMPVACRYCTRDAYPYCVDNCLD